MEKYKFKCKAIGEFLEKFLGEYGWKIKACGNGIVTIHYKLNAEHYYKTESEFLELMLILINTAFPNSYNKEVAMIENYLDNVKRLNDLHAISQIRQ